jgi:hypothetical protein
MELKFRMDSSTFHSRQEQRFFSSPPCLHLPWGPSIGCRGPFPRSKVGGVWSWTLTSIKFWGLEYVLLYFHSPLRVHDVSLVTFLIVNGRHEHNWLCFNRSAGRCVPFEEATVHLERGLSWVSSVLPGEAGGVFWWRNNTRKVSVLCYLTRCVGTTQKPSFYWLWPPSCVVLFIPASCPGKHIQVRNGRTHW